MVEKMGLDVDHWRLVSPTKQGVSCILGHSAVASALRSEPCGFGAQGLPIGLQVGGRPGGEETVLKIAHAYEQGTVWHTMRPPTV